MDRYGDYLHNKAPGTLTQFLVKDAVFGPEMKKCTTFGLREKYALPKYGLFVIKILGQSPEF